MNIKKIFCLLAFFGLAACAVNNPKTSYIGNIQQQSYSVISNAIAQYASTVLPIGSSLLWVNPSPKNHDLQQDIENALRQKGFAIAPSSAARPTNSFEVRYWIERLNNNNNDQTIMVRIFINNKIAGLIFAPTTNGAFSAYSPYTVME